MITLKVSNCHLKLLLELESHHNVQVNTVGNVLTYPLNFYILNPFLKQYMHKTSLHSRNASFICFLFPSTIRSNTCPENGFWLHSLFLISKAQLTPPLPPTHTLKVRVLVLGGDFPELTTGMSRHRESMLYVCTPPCLIIYKWTRLSKIWPSLLLVF